MDWDAFLGPDLHPSTPAAATSHAKPPQKRKRDSSPAPTASVAADMRVPPPPTNELTRPFLPTTPAYFAQPRHPRLQQVPMVPTFATQRLRPLYLLPPPQQLQQGPQARKPSKSAALIQPRLDFCPSLRAFFASVKPDRDLGPVTNHLVSAGVSSIDSLADMLLMDDGSVDGFIERIPKLGAVERAFLRKAVFAARASIEVLS